MLATSFQIHDIRDAEGFVKAAVRRSGIRFTPDEREEMVAEGLAILWELGQRFEPRREGYAQEGRFSGYAARYLPGRLSRAWHRNHREHRVVVGEDGKKHWVYGQAPQSLNALGQGKADRLIQPARNWLSVATAAVATARAQA